MSYIKYHSYIYIIYQLYMSSPLEHAVHPSCAEPFFSKNLHPTGHLNIPPMPPDTKRKCYANVTLIVKGVQVQPSATLGDHSAVLSSGQQCKGDGSHIQKSPCTPPWTQGCAWAFAYFEVEQIGTHQQQKMEEVLSALPAEK